MAQEITVASSAGVLEKPAVAITPSAVCIQETKSPIGDPAKPSGEESEEGSNLESPIFGTEKESERRRWETEVHPRQSRIGETLRVGNPIQNQRKSQR